MDEGGKMKSKLFSLSLENRKVYVNRDAVAYIEGVAQYKDSRPGVEVHIHLVDGTEFKLDTTAEFLGDLLKDFERRDDVRFL
jgi:hypothetical protein